MYGRSTSGTTTRVGRIGMRLAGREGRQGDNAGVGAPLAAPSGVGLATPRYRYAVIRSRPPMYGRSTSGTTTLPSACW